MKIRNSLLLLIACTTAGCWQKSVSPFYTAKDIVSEPALAGVWQEPGSAEKSNQPKWEFVPGTGQRFDLTIQTDEERHDFDLFVFKLGGERYLDLLSKERRPSTVPAHHLFKLVGLGPDLRLAALNPDWVQKHLRQNPALAHIVVPNPEERDDRDKDELILTADTAALQKLIREHQGKEGFFGEPVVLKRPSNTPAAEKKQ